MWTSVLERIGRLTGGQREGGVVITTRRIDVERLAFTPLEPPDARTPRKLTALAERAVNFDTSIVGEYTPSNGWHRDDMVETLPHEGSGPPAAGGSWHIARRLMVDYQLADPRAVRAVYRPDAPLAGRDILLKIRFAGMRFNVGVRVGKVYDETRQLDGRHAQVFGWYYQTLTVISRKGECTTSYGSGSTQATSSFASTPSPDPPRPVRSYCERGSASSAGPTSCASTARYADARDASPRPSWRPKQARGRTRRKLSLLDPGRSPKNRTHADGNKGGSSFRAATNTGSIARNARCNSRGSLRNSQSKRAGRSDVGTPTPAGRPEGHPRSPQPAANVERTRRLERPGPQSRAERPTGAHAPSAAEASRRPYAPPARRSRQHQALAT